MERVAIDTPYGPPSDAVFLGELGGRSVAFMPRHGAAHSLPPHLVNYRANAWAMRSLGVTRIIGPCAAGSLQPSIHPGDLVICDQLIDRTWGRADTFHEGPRVAHVSLAEPYCPELRRLALAAGEGAGATVHAGGVVVVTQGPRFATIAESRALTQAGWQVINMTQYPEVALARELEMCYVNVSLITDYDAGVAGGAAPVTAAEVARVFAGNLDRLRRLLELLLPTIPAERTCLCATAMRDAVLGG